LTFEPKDLDMKPIAELWKQSSAFVARFPMRFMTLAIAVGCIGTAAVLVAGLSLEGPGFLCTMQALCTKTQKSVVGVPQQIHVSLAPESETALTVSWAVPANVAETHAEFRVKGAAGTEVWTPIPTRSAKTSRNGILGVPERLHHAIAEDLQPGQRYEY
jgi:hypothetical protein